MKKMASSGTKCSPVERTLAGKVAIISGGDTELGQTISLSYAQLGADVVVLYQTETNRIGKIRKQIEKSGCRALFISGNLHDEKFCHSAMQQAIATFGGIDIIVNHPQKKKPAKPLQNDVIPYLQLTKAALKHLKKDSIIINTTPKKGVADSAITSFTRTLALSLASRNIRVNGVIPRNLSDGFQTPKSVVPCFVFLASSDATKMTGQILHP